MCIDFIVNRADIPHAQVISNMLTSLPITLSLVPKLELSKNKKNIQTQFLDQATSNPWGRDYAIDNEALEEKLNNKQINSRKEKQILLWSWSDGLVLKITFCSCRRPKLGSQYRHGSSQYFVTPFPGDSAPSSGLQEYFTSGALTHTKQNTHKRNLGLS